ncbi:hypothetical protein AAY473_031146 [Plecturocebus cupreus]
MIQLPLPESLPQHVGILEDTIQVEIWMGTQPNHNRSLLGHCSHSRHDIENHQRFQLMWNQSSHIYGSNQAIPTISTTLADGPSHVSLLPRPVFHSDAKILIMVLFCLKPECNCHCSQDQVRRARKANVPCPIRDPLLLKLPLLLLCSMHSALHGFCQIGLIVTTINIISVISTIISSSINISIIRITIIISSTISTISTTISSISTIIRITIIIISSISSISTISISTISTIISSSINITIIRITIIIISSISTISTIISSSISITIIRITIISTISTIISSSITI